MSSVTQLLNQYGPAAARLAKTPRVQAGFAALLALRLLPWINTWASRSTANNGITDKSWDWSKEIVVVTGGSSGIGANIVRQLEQRHIKVIILDMNPPSTKTGPNTTFYQADISDPSVIADVASRIRAEHGDPTVLINNAGIGNNCNLFDVPTDGLRKLFDVNLLAPFLLVREFVPAMVRHNHGHIVNIASLASFSTQACNVDYAASKAGLLALHEGLKQELKHVHMAPAVRATVVHPTWVRTPMIMELARTGKLGGPTVESTDVATAVTRQLFSGYGAQIVVPPSMGWTALVRGFPVWFQERMRDTISLSLLGAMEAAKRS